jgi:hypothetical protein
MLPQIRKEAPPFVRFEYVECGVDAEASAKAGGVRIPLVRPFALIMQHGSKDVVEKDAEEWLKQIEDKAIQGTYNPEWAQRFKMQFEQFLKGNELPRQGTPIRTWPAPNREQVIRLQALGITTVEDLAAIPDSACRTSGLDGRYLRDLAKNYLEDSKGAGQMAKQLADLQQSNRDKDETIKRMEASIAALEAAVGSKTLHVKK